jgi:hypothetical protein
MLTVICTVNVQRRKGEGLDRDREIQSGGGGGGGGVQVGTPPTLKSQFGRATLDSSSSVAGFGPFVHGGSRLGIWMVAFFLVRGPRYDYSQKFKDPVCNLLYL